jgi:hypothetical protein
MKRSAPLVALVALGTGLALAGPAFADGRATSTHHSPAAHVHATHYALSGSGYGSRIVGGQVPAGSGTTAYQVIGCTVDSGLSKTNDVAQLTVPGVGTLQGLKTHIWTTRHGAVVTSHARHKVAALVLASTPVGSLSINGIVSSATAFHDATGFHTSTTTDLGTITLTPVVGPAQTFPAPTPGMPLTIPGVATIVAGKSTTHENAGSASADVWALKVTVLLSGTQVKLAHARARIAGGVDFGLFRGHSDATRVSALADNLKSGPNPLTVMPCQGTGGAVQGSSVAHVNLAGLLVVKALRSQQRSSQTAQGAKGYERARIARINLGNGQLVVDGIVAKASVTRTSDHHSVVSAKGTAVGTITAGGQVLTFPKTGPLEIPGVAKLQRHLVRRTATGIKVTALRITLLDGTGAVIDLGEAQIRVSHLV